MNLTRFDFTPEIIERFREESIIPVNFYNKNGQILINRKERASIHEINQLLKFQAIGIYFDQNDYRKMTGEETPADTEPPPAGRVIPRGLTDTKLLSREAADALTALADELFRKLKKETIDSVHTRKANRVLTDIFDDFSAQPDAMVGIINILELMNTANCSFEVELAVKRTVVAMALKTRGMLAQTDEERGRMRNEISTIMLASLLSDIAFLRMNLPPDRQFSDKEYMALKQHPLISYLMVVGEPALTHEVKMRILFQHYMQKGKPNNDPSLALIDLELENRKSKRQDIA